MNFFKKITTIAFVTVFLFGTATSALAAAQWNTHPGDLSTVASKKQGAVSYGATTYAQAGDKVAVRIYYHNTGIGPAANTTFTMSTPTGSKTTHTITGSVGAPGTGTKSGSTTIQLSSAQTLTYIPGSIRFYRYNQNVNATAVNSDTAIFNGGLNVGTIPGMETCPVNNDFCEQGVVAVAFQVSNTAPVVHQCSDGIDNDSDGKTDYPSDPGCTSSVDDNEYNAVVVTYQCNDGIDNDGDGYTDYPSDAGCSSSTDNNEYNTIAQNTCKINSFYASPTNVVSGGTTRLYWSTTDCTTVTIDGVAYSVDGNGYFGPLYSGRTYNIYATNSTSSDSDSEYVSVNQVNQTYQCNDGIDNDGDGYTDYPSDAGCSSSTDNSEYNAVASAPIVTTLNPSSLTLSSGQLNGMVTNAGNATTQMYFEWGTDTGNLFNTTNYQSANGNNTITFFDTIYGLSTSTTYYYRAVAKTNGIVYRGEIKSFRLVAGGTTTIFNPAPIFTTVVQQSQPQGFILGLGTNLVQLKFINNQFNTVNNGTFGTVSTVNDGVQNVCVNDMAKFVVEYRNISNTVLTNAILHIDIPKDVEFRSSSAGVYNKADNTITVNVGTLNPDQAGTVSFDGLVLSSAANRDLLVVPATLSFENPNNGARETAIAYGLATSQNCVRNSLAGFAFGAGFFPNTLIGWLLLILVILALAYLIRRWFFLPVVTRTTDRRRVIERHYEDMDVPTAPYQH